MAKHDGAADNAEALDGADGDVDSIVVDIDAEDFDAADSEHAAGKAAKRRVPEWISRIPKPITVGVGTIAALLAVSGWLGFRLHQDHQVQDQRSLYVQVARQTAINLTTINYAQVDADIKRVLDSATGGFHEEFQNRSKPFVEVVKKVQSKTEGTIAEAGLLSYTKEQGQVLVAISVKTSLGGAPPDQEPRRWRMRLTVDKTGDGATVSNVEFVP
jgi:Mce-associated membrane protein